MFKIFNSKRVSLQILIICIFFSFVKLEITYEKFEDLKIDNKAYNNSFEGNKYYHINYIYGNNTNFIKVQLEGIDNKNEYLIKYYYEDGKKNIYLNQSAKSYTRNSIMWLNKAQIGKGFYLSFECRASPCKYNFIIEPKDKVELKIGESYTYYVNEQSLKMSFSIEGTPLSYFPNYNNTNFYLSIWAKGYKKIDSKIDGKTSNENAYTIPVQKDFNYILEVSGTQGDLINVGALLFDEYNICQTPIKSFNGEEINGIFDANEMNKVCFIFEDSDLNILYSYESLIKRYTELSEQEHNSEKIRCLNKTKDTNFYSFHITKNKDDINILNALIGKSYSLEMKEGEKIGIIPKILVEEKSNYLTYHIKKSSGVYNSDIFSLNDYPFYNISKAEKLEGSYFLSYIDDELKDFYSPIGPNQKLLLISCVKDSCSININIFDYNSRISINKLMPFYNYIRKDTENKLQLNDLESGFNYMLFFESLSGPNDHFTLDFGNLAQIDNKGIYEIKPNATQNSFNLNLKSKENHMYNLAAIKFEENGNEGSITAHLISDINYMFKFNNKIHKYHIDLSKLNSIKEYYLFINSRECNISLDNNNNNNKIIKIENNSYGYFYNSNSNEELMVNKVNSNVANCRFDISLFQYKQSNNELNNIILSKDKPHIFVFYKDQYKQVKYMHIFTKKDLGLKLEIKLNTTNITKAKLDLYYNTNKAISENQNLDANNNIELRYDDISDECKDDFKPCTITFSITLDEIKGGETAEVSIRDSDYISKMKKFYLVLTVAGGGVLFLIIVIIIICACKNKNSYDRLTKEVNAISFKEDEDKDNEGADNKADDLLY